MIDIQSAEKADQVELLAINDKQAPKDLIKSHRSHTSTKKEPRMRNSWNLVPSCTLVISVFVGGTVLKWSIGAVAPAQDLTDQLLSCVCYAGGHVIHKSHAFKQSWLHGEKTMLSPITISFKDIQAYFQTKLSCTPGIQAMDNQLFQDSCF